MAHLTASFWNRRVSEYRSRNTAMFVGSCADAIIDGRQRSRGQAGVPANPADTTAVECSKLDWLEARRRSKMDRLRGVHSERWNCASKRRLTTSLCLYDQRVKNNRRPARHTGGGRQVTFRSFNHATTAALTLTQIVSFRAFAMNSLRPPQYRSWTL